MKKEIVIGSKVKLISEKIDRRYESINGVDYEFPKLELGSEYIVSDIDVDYDDDSNLIRLEGYQYYHPSTKFELLNN